MNLVPGLTGLDLCREHLRTMGGSLEGAASHSRTTRVLAISHGHCTFHLRSLLHLGRSARPISDVRTESVGEVRSSSVRGSCPSFTANLIAGHWGNTWMATGFACTGLQASGYVFRVCTYV